MPSAITTRRRLLKTTGAAAIVGLAGCTGDGGDGGSDGGDGGSDGGGGDGGGDGSGDGGGGTTSPSSDGPYKVGYLQPLSGALSTLGAQCLNATELTVAQVNERGGFEGATVELHTEDTEVSPETAVNRARKLVQNDGVDILVGCISSSVAKAVSEYAAQQNVPYIANTAHTADLNHANCRKTTFRTTTNVIMRGKCTAYGVANLTTRDDTKIVGINPDYVFGHQVWDHFKTAMQERRPDVEFAMEAFPAAGKGDYSNEIQQAMSHDPDIAISFMSGQDLLSFFKQAPQYNFFEEIPHFGYFSTLNNIYTLGNDFPDGHIIAMCNTTPEWPDTEEHNAWTDAYVSEYDAEPTQVAYSAGGTIRGLEEAVAASGGTSSDDVIGGLEGLTYESMVQNRTVRAVDHQGVPDELLVGEVVPLDGRDRYGFQPPFNTVPKSLFADEPTCDLSS